MEGRLPETVLKGGAGSGVLRPRLVTAGSGGPGHRPPGMTTWLRGEIVRLSALRPPLSSGGRDHKDKTRAQQHAAGTKKTTLFDIVNTATANGSLRAPRFGTPPSRVPAERASAKSRDTQEDQPARRFAR